MSKMKMSFLTRSADGIVAGAKDFYPTPPWATRALFEDVLYTSMSEIWEPACGNGMMAEVLKDYCNRIVATDIHDYGYGKVEDFLTSERRASWIITNPPFSLALEFAQHALK